jgi:glycosyltransferase involved in cell wall biosynthesis
MKSPKVSICIPAYLQTEYLKKTLESVCIQTFQDYEVIMTDDSPDDSVLRLLETFSLGEKLKYSKNSVRLGSPQNWNECISRASGEYIKLLHHDDWFPSPDSLARYVCMLDESPSSDFAFSATSVFHSKEGIFTTNCPDAEWLKKLSEDPSILFFGNLIGAPSATIYRRNTSMQYDPKIKYVVDIEFYVRMLIRSPQFQFCPDSLICTTSDAAHQVTADYQNNKRELFEFAYLYNKIRKTGLPEKKFISYFYNAFRQYNINSLNEFREAGFEPPRPTGYFSYMLLKKRVRALLGM